MQEQALQFTDADKLGRVVAVDTGRVHIDVDNHDLLTRASVSKLIGILRKYRSRIFDCSG